MLTRGEFLRTAGGAAAGLAVWGAGADAALLRRRGRAGRALAARFSPYETYWSRPDLSPPAAYMSYPPGAPSTDQEGYLLLAPTARPGAQAGVLIVDAHGHPVWFHPVPLGLWASNFRVHRYRGRPVLAWWQGIVRPPGYGYGEGVLFDTSYRQIATVRAARGRQADLHEFTLTPWGSALITCHPETVQADLSALGGPTNGQVLESIVQEIDIHSGRLLFEWRSLEHVPVHESLAPVGNPYDYLHVNSVDPTPDGNLLISGRNSSTIYKVDRRSGRVLWRLGGQHSDFAFGHGARFNWQHDAQHVARNRISVFDNGFGPLKTEGQSRGLVLHVDQRRRQVRLLKSYRHPTPLLTGAMGSVQPLLDGNVVVGWGLIPTVSEFSPGGALLSELRLPWGYNCYRAYKMPWSGRPADRPAVAAGPGRSSGTTMLYVSWNGATGVSSWRVSVGPSPASMQVLTTRRRDGFETAIQLSQAHGYATVSALGAHGAVLGTSAPLKF